jgi:hypothetical protein
VQVYDTKSGHVNFVASLINFSDMILVRRPTDREHIDFGSPPPVDVNVRAGRARAGSPTMIYR